MRRSLPRFQALDASDDLREASTRSQTAEAEEGEPITRDSSGREREIRSKKKNDKQCTQKSPPKLLADKTSTSSAKKDKGKEKEKVDEYDREAVEKMMEKLKRPLCIDTPDSPKKKTKEKQVQHVPEQIVDTAPKKSITCSGSTSYKSLKCYSTPGQLYDIVKEMTPMKKQVVRDLGFGCLLDWDISSLPEKINFWVLKHFDPNSCTLKVGKDNICVTADDVNRYIGLPRGPLKVDVQRNCLIHNY